MAEKDIWAQLEEFKKNNPDEKPKRKKKRPKADDKVRSMLGNAVKQKKNRKSYIDSAIKKALGKP